MAGFYSAAALPADGKVAVYDLAMMGVDVEAFSVPAGSGAEEWTAALAEGGWRVTGGWMETGTGGDAGGPMWQANVERAGGE